MKAALHLPMPPEGTRDYFYHLYDMALEESDRMERAGDRDGAYLLRTNAQALLDEAVKAARKAEAAKS